jgi:hypothetical protein
MLSCVYDKVEPASPKSWSTNIPKEVVHVFRTVIHETGAHRDYIISRVGFSDRRRRGRQGNQH